MSKPLPLICLRGTQASDLDFVLAAENAPDNRPFVMQWTRDEHQQALLNSDTSHQLIERPDSGQPVGYAILAGRTSRHRRINLRRLVIVEKGRGYGRAALRQLKRQVFADRQANRFWLDVKLDNQRARYLYEQEGWVLEGILREAYWIGGAIASVALLSILASEYQARLARGLETQL